MRLWAGLLHKVQGRVTTAVDPTPVLDELVQERLSRSWDIRRQQDGKVITYAVTSPAGGRVELGQ